MTIQIGFTLESAIVLAIGFVVSLILFEWWVKKSVNKK